MKDIIKKRTELNDIENKINKAKSWFFEDKREKPLARLIKKEGRRNKEYQE